MTMTANYKIYPFANVPFMCEAGITTCFHIFIDILKFPNPVKATVLILAVLTLAMATQAQPLKINYRKIDSLKSIVAKSQGTAKARPLTELAVAMLDINSDSSKIFFEQAYSLADEAGVDTLRSGVTSRFCIQAVDQGDTEYVRHRLVMIRDAEWFNALPGRYKSEIYNAFFDIHYWSTSDYDSCIYYTRKWIDTATDTLWLAYGYLEQGASYNELGNNVKALESLNTCESLLPAVPQDRDLASSLYNNFGMLYSDEHEYKKASEYFLKALDYGKGSKVPAANLPMLNNLGVLHLWMGEYKTALEYFNTTAALLPAYGQPWSNANNVLNIGTALTLSGQPKEGLQKYKQSLEMFTKLNEHHKIASLHRLMAEAYRLMGMNKDAEREALLCLDWDENEGSGELEKESVQELYKIYSATGQYEKVYKYQSRYLAIVDSLNGAERKTNFGLVEKNYELAQQERIRESLENENQLHHARAETDRVTRIALIVGSIALAIGVVIAGRAYRRSRLQTQKIEAQAQQLHEAAKTKARFFANVSHELRTPVTLLHGMLELLKDSSPQNGHSEKMEIALGNSRKLQSMLDDVLDLSRIETGKWANVASMELSTRPRELLPLLTRIVFAFESLLIKKNIELKYEATALAGLEIDIDEDKFEKIINNLVYNAAKFNHEGGWIKVSGQRTETNIVIQVSDSGVGIPEKDLPYIFDRYYQSSSTERLHAQGIGIGLSLVREFALLHGGDVTVTSVVNEGSCFTVQIPIRVTAPVSSEHHDNAEVVDVTFNNFTHKPLVLIVEDNDEMRFYLKEILGNHVSTAEAPNGRHALEYLKSHKPDLIISDVMMPEMDGYEFLTHLKANVAPGSTASHRGIPVVMLTARAAEEDMLQGLSLGVDDYIIKPFSAKELKIRIHNLLANQEIRREWSTKGPDPEEMITNTPENELFVEKVKEFVEANASNASLGIGDLGEYLAMSERQVYRKAATLTGMTPGQLIKEIRLKVAYKLLLERKVTKVSDVAHRVGFENSSYFSRQFLERYGKRPTDFLS
jgi:signal transduction histidine kinase/CheY-like chemotaxis protein/AraC-like DNA-binding protein